jgi:hypothetical protein
MASLDEAQSLVAALFQERRSLDSRDRWSKAGFDVIARDDDEKIMVAGHPAAPSYMFKRFVNDVSEKKQRKNYETRVAGIATLRQRVIERQLTRIALPQKWIVELPSKIGGAVLVVEKLSLLPDRQLKDAYGTIDETTLHDLCVMLHAYRGLDSGPRNVPLTTEGRIAFIDTERWDQDRDRPYLKRLKKYLSSSSQKLADDVFARLG